MQKLVKQKFLAQFNKKTPMITSAKEFKTVLRQINVVPTYISEYKALNVYKVMNTPSMDAMSLLESFYVIFSSSMKPHDIIDNSSRFSS